jgi:CheY-like chemotaxis protein
MVCPETVVPSKPTERRTTVQTSEIPVVLIVEDNPDNMLTIKALLSGRCRVVEASDGKSGIEKTYQYKPDLVLMDIALPGINGIEVLKELRKDDELGRIPIIAVSASAMKGDRESLMAHGFDGYLSKPIEARLFFEIIDEWIALA